MATRLETEGINKRNADSQKSLYQRSVNEYSEVHPNAISDGDEKGKGTNSQLPDYVNPGGLNKGYFRSVDTDAGGNKIDIQTRNKHNAMNVYGPNNAYDESSINVSQTIDGQAFINTYYLS